MELEFIEINVAKSKEMYLRHMTELMYVPVYKNDTWNDLLDKVLSFRSDGEYKEAAKEWVEMNRDRPDLGELNKKIFPKPIKGNKMYAIFNLIKHKK